MRMLPNAAFPIAEYERRLAAVEQKRNEFGLDAAIIASPENICYLAGYDSVGYFALQALVLVPAAEPVLIVRELELANASATSIFDRTFGYRDQEVATDVIADAIEGMCAVSPRIGIELRSRSISSAQITALQQRLPAATFVDCFGVVEGPRLVKSSNEIAYIREAAAIADAGMKASLAAIRAGARERDVAAVAYDVLIRSGSEWTGAPVFVSSGERTARAHTTWSDRSLATGDPVFLEVNVARRRYHAALMRSTCVALADPRYRSMCEASQAGLEAAIAAIKPGVRAADVDHACRRAIENRGWGDQFRLRTGYSIGIGFENFAEGQLLSLHSRNSVELCSGMVLHLVPYLADPAFAGCAFSETVIVSDGGAEPLSRLPRDLFL